MCKKDIMEVTVTGRGYIPRKSSLRRLMKRHDLSTNKREKSQEPHSCNLNSFEVIEMKDFSSNFPTPIGEGTASSRILHDSIQQKCKLQLQPENSSPPSNEYNHQISNFGTQKKSRNPQVVSNPNPHRAAPWLDHWWPPVLRNYANPRTLPPTGQPQRWGESRK